MVLYLTKTEAHDTEKNFGFRHVSLYIATEVFLEKIYIVDLIVFRLQFVFSKVKVFYFF